MNIWTRIFAYCPIIVHEIIVIIFIIIPCTPIKCIYIFEIFWETKIKIL